MKIKKNDSSSSSFSSLFSVSSYKVTKRINKELKQENGNSLPVLIHCNFSTDQNTVAFYRVQNWWQKFDQLTDQHFFYCILKYTQTVAVTVLQKVVR